MRCSSMPDTLMILDYSGTLSQEAALFARPTTLMKHLEESGLRQLGIDSPALFWDELVNPTWEEGSTTTAGYKSVLTQKLSARIASVPVRAIANAVSSFVDSYFHDSRIDPRWESTLHALSASPDITTIIATDHYAEATRHIIKFLKEFGIQAQAAKQTFSHPQRRSFIVANSADLGFHKAEPRFWEILLSGLNLGTVRRVLLVDDFGSNEQRQDAYADRQKVEARKEKTVSVLESVLSARVDVMPFIIEDGNLPEDALYGNLIKEVHAAIARYIASSI
jgi:hypothetical protein